MTAPLQLHLFKGKRQRGVRPPPPSEFTTHCAIADTLRLQLKRDWFFSHIGSGELRTKETGARLKRMGLKPGLFDFLLIDPKGQHYWLELKRGTRGRMTEDQLVFAALLEARKVPHAVAHSYGEAIDKLAEWKALRGQ